jgi:hypothetical protein
MGIYGIDVASYQPDRFSLSVNGKKAEFVFIKATEGISYTNPRFAAQRAWAISNGLRVGYYHFLHAGNAAAQITYFHQFLTRGNYLRSGDMVACDWESYQAGGKTYNASNADKNQFIDNALKAFPESRVLLYCNTYQYKNVEKGSYVGDGLWIAAPSDPDGKPSIKDPWVFQQVGVSGQDIDYCKFATRADLDKWADGKVKKMPNVDPVDGKSQTYREVWETDAAAPPAGHETPENPTWWPMSLLKYACEQIDVLNKKVDDLSKKVQ